MDAGQEFTGRAGQMRMSEWLASEDIDGLGDVRVTIERVMRRQSVVMSEGRRLPVVYSIKFAGKDKEMILNNTNRKTLVRAYGADVKQWKGKPVTLYVDHDVKLKGEKVSGLRFRDIGQSASTPAPAEGGKAE